jgi:hypothetical protein
MTPSQYKARYENLKVPLNNGSTAAVRINQYRLRSRNYDAAAANAFFAQLKKNGLDMELRVDTGAETFRVAHRTADGGVSVNEMTRTGPVKVESEVYSRVKTIARYVFAGKGAPEHCQIVLQLVDHWNLAPDGLQKYADKSLGLDCNGFVGNYLWHVKRAHHWSELGVGNLDVGPDAFITAYFHGKKLLSRWEDLNASRSYIMGLVDSSGNIVPGGPGSREGHIVITEPNRLRPPTMKAPPAVWAVESTGAHIPGLWESWYSCRRVDHAKRIFTIYREEMMSGHQVYPFKIAEL